MLDEPGMGLPVAETVAPFVQGRPQRSGGMAIRSGLVQGAMHGDRADRFATGKQRPGQQDRQAQGDRARWPAVPRRAPKDLARTQHGQQQREPDQDAGAGEDRAGRQGKGGDDLGCHRGQEGVEDGQHEAGRQREVEAHRSVEQQDKDKQ
ncbi:hypothetical protein GCM10027359_01570 [Marilutibacter aestuarii]